ncbi:MAG: hypothetical protein CMJ83_03090, partial [Planctomycetes bacterium]|nr:hypothetical protein [Planctomycetota bacterium]
MGDRVPQPATVRGSAGPASGVTHEARIDGRAPTWSRIAMAGVVLLVLKFSLSHVVDPWRYTGDARQHVFWTYRFADPELFPDDLMVEFISTFRFDPPGFQAAYAVGARAMDALLFSKLLGALLCLVSGALAWDVGRRAAGPRAGALCALLVGALVFDNMRYALPRAFAFPAVLMMLQALQAKSPLRASVAILAAGLFYPALLPVFGTACGVRLL